MKTNRRMSMKNDNRSTIGVNTYQYQVRKSKHISTIGRAICQ